jgi:L-aspartate oxidase
LRDAHGERFVDELASRDVVSRAMTARMLAQGVEHLWLDATGLERFDERFPTIATAVRGIGLDPTVDWLPIAPAAHYLSGGVVTDLDGASALPGLWACGEVACTGVHGANRLASNSLLEGMVFAPRVVEAVLAGVDGPQPTGAMRAVLGDDGGRFIRAPDIWAGPAQHPGDVTPAKARDELQRALTAHAGVLRDASSLRQADRAAEQAGTHAFGDDCVEVWELRNLATVARALIAAASVREESRGAHTRTDFPDMAARFQLRLVIGNHE